MAVKNIDPGNKALKYVDKRIEHEKYRGKISSQHNRYTFSQVISILSLIKKYAPDKKLMRIRTTDISKRPENKPEEYDYAKFCNDAKSKTGIGTQDAMRKNLFPDFHRMGFIERYDKNKESIMPYERKRVRYVSLSKQGLKLIEAKNILNKYFIFSKGIDRLLEGRIELLLTILRDETLKIDYIHFFEYMFFISSVFSDTEFGLNLKESVELVKEYRKLTPTQRKAVIEKLRKELDPKNYNGDKKIKRDFHNWSNKIQQIFYLLNQTIYFEIKGEKLAIKTEKEEEPRIGKKLKRSYSEKDAYFKKHNIKKRKGFELHHIIPLSWSESMHHFELLDKWNNMLYIDGFSHSKISQNRNKNIVLKSKGKDLILEDYSENKVYLNYKNNVLYNPKNRKKIKEYNNKLLKVVE